MQGSWFIAWIVRSSKVSVFYVLLFDEIGSSLDDVVNRVETTSYDLVFLVHVRLFCLIGDRGDVTLSELRLFY